MMYVSDARQQFYEAVWILALAGGSNNWCRATEQHTGPAGVVALVPRAYADPALAPWPTLPEGDPQGQPGWLPSPDRIEAAFTAILRTNGPRVEVGGPSLVSALHMAEQHLEIAELAPALADRVLQVAVFGRVVFA